MPREQDLRSICMRVLLYNIPDVSLPNTRIYKMPHSGIGPECGIQCIFKLFQVRTYAVL